MKQFNKKKFCDDLISARGDKSQEFFAKNVGISRTTLSFFENGKQLPNMEQFNAICTHAGLEPGDYFSEIEKDSLVYLMGKLQKKDREKVEKMAERIRLKEKYEYLAKRSMDVID